MHQWRLISLSIKGTLTHGWKTHPRAHGVTLGSNRLVPQSTQMSLSLTQRGKWWCTFKWMEMGLNEIVLTPRCVFFFLKVCCQSRVTKVKLISLKLCGSRNEGNRSHYSHSVRYMRSFPFEHDNDSNFSCDYNTHMTGFLQKISLWVAWR